MQLRRGGALSLQIRTYAMPRLDSGRTCEPHTLPLWAVLCQPHREREVDASIRGSHSKAHRNKTRGDSRAGNKFAERENTDSLGNAGARPSSRATRDEHDVVHSPVPNVTDRARGVATIHKKAKISPQKSMWAARKTTSRSWL